MAKKNLIIISAPGVGKTRMLSSAVLTPELMPALYIDFEDNADSIESRIADFKIVEITATGFVPPTDKLTRVRISAWESMGKLMVGLRAMKDKNPYKVIMLDTITTAAWYSLRWARDNASSLNSKETRLESPLGNKIAMLPDFGRQNEDILDMILDFKNMPGNFIMTGHIKEIESEDDANKVSISLTKELHNRVPGMFPALGMITVPKKDATGSRRQIDFTRTNTRLTKDNSEGGKLSAGFNYGVDDPILGMILSQMGMPLTIPGQGTHA